MLSYRSLPHWGRGTASAVDRVLSLTACLRRSPPLFHTAPALSGSLRSPPSPRGEGFVRRYCFPHVSCIRFDVMGIAVLSYRSLPHWGRGTASAVDRVLSYIVDLRCIPPSFSYRPCPIRLAPLATFPAWGRLCFGIAVFTKDGKPVNLLNLLSLKTERTIYPLCESS